MAAILQKPYDCMTCHKPIRLQRKDDNTGWLKFELDGTTFHKCEKQKKTTAATDSTAVNEHLTNLEKRVEYLITLAERIVSAK